MLEECAGEWGQVGPGVDETIWVSSKWFGRGIETEFFFLHSPQNYKKTKKYLGVLGLSDLIGCTRNIPEIPYPKYVF